MEHYCSPEYIDHVCTHTPSQMFVEKAHLEDARQMHLLFFLSQVICRYFWQNPFAKNTSKIVEVAMRRSVDGMLHEKTNLHAIILR